MAWPTLSRTAGRLPGSRYRDDLARLATHGELDAEQLIDLARSGRRSGVSDFDARGLAWFGHLIASEMESADHVQNAADIFELAYRIGGRRAMGRDLDFVWVQCLALSGRLDSFRSALRASTGIRDALWAADTDALHPGSSGLEAGIDDQHPDHGEWLDSLNRPLTAAQLEPLTILAGGGNPFDRIECAVPDGASITQGPVVTVVVPVYNPGPSLRTTVRSLLAQTWRPLEILLCDDASTTGTELFDEMVAADPRVHHIRAPHNGGTYAARNHGVGAATGQYVTFNDADDWSHPRRIERQLAAIAENPDSRASVSWCVRIKEDLSLTVIGRPPSRVNLSSILMERNDVLTDLGGFDGLRKGADSEFVERFRVRFGADSIAESRDPLALVQLTGGSLSRDDYRFLRTHPARLQYMAAFRHWHQLLSEDPAAAYLPPGGRAPFPAPDYLLGAPPRRRTVDVLFCANLTPESITSVDLAGEIGAVRSSGLSVGLLETLAPLDLTVSVRHPSGPLAAAIHDGVPRALPGAEVETRLLVLRDPAGVSAMPRAHFGGVRAEAALLVADYDPDNGRAYQPGRVEDLLVELTGVTRVCWLPSTTRIAESLRAAGATGHLLPPGHVAVPTEDPPLPTPHPTGSAGRLAGVVARSPRTDTDYPDDWSERLDQLPDDRRLISWGASSPGNGRGRIGHLPASQISMQTFLRLTDVVVVPTVPLRGPVLTRPIAVALSAGKVLLLEPAYRSVLGEAALYSDEYSLAELTADDAFPHDEQRERALTWARAHLGAAALRTHVARALETPTIATHEES